MDPNGYLAFALLIAALALFLISTRQFRLWLRVVVLLAGVGLLVGAGVLVAEMEGHSGLLRMVGDIWANRTSMGDSVLAIAMQRNEASVARHVLPLLDLFLFVAGLLGALAAAALTPGMLIERIARPLTFMLVGVMLGTVVALSIVAVGFGGYVDPRGYAGVVDKDDIYDGDTFWVGEMSLRLFGVDAPERRQPCTGDAECGLTAADHLAVLMREGLVRCEVQENQAGSVTESFGRPLATCFIRRVGEPEFNLAERMIQDGYAVGYPEGESLEAFSDAERAIGNTGLMAGCWLHPKAWRRDDDARTAFREGRYAAIPAEYLVGAGCSPPSLLPQAEERNVTP